MKNPDMNCAEGFFIVLYQFGIRSETKDRAAISPLYGLVHRNGEKMSADTFILLLSKLMLIVLRSSTGPVDIYGLRIFIISHTDKALNLIVIMQRQRIYFHIRRNFISADVPTIVFPELFQIRPAFNPKDYRIFQLTRGSIAQTGNNLIDP